jgi:hypothetical protein
MSQSIVRRGHQSRTASEPDIVVQSPHCNWWFELHDGGSRTPESKYKQATDDVMRACATNWKKIVVIHHRKNSTKISATLNIGDFINTLGWNILIQGEYDSILQSLITMDHRDFFALLEFENGKARTTSQCSSTPDRRMEGVC